MVDVASQSSSEWRRGWLALLAATGATSTGAALFVYSSNLFLKSIEASQGWTRAEISFGAILSSAASACLMPFIGILTDKYGSRNVGLVGTLAYTLLLIILANIPADLMVYYITLLLIGGVYSATTAVVFVQPVVRCFHKNRGLALGIMMSGAAILMIPLSPVINMVIHDFGWRSGYWLLAGLSLLIGLPSIFTLSRQQSAAPAVAAIVQGRDYSLKEALFTKAYFKLIVSVICATLALGGYLHHMASLMSDRGFSVLQVGLIVSIFMAMIIIGRISVGFLLDRLNPIKVSAAIMFLASCGGVMLLLFPAPLFAMCVLIVMLIGAAMGAESDMQAFFIGRMFGLKRFASIFATTAMSTSICLGAGAYLFGYIYTQSGNYDYALAFATLLFLIAGLAFVSLYWGQERARILDQSDDRPALEGAE